MYQSLRCYQYKHCAWHLSAQQVQVRGEAGQSFCPIQSSNDGCLALSLDRRRFDRMLLRRQDLQMLRTTVAYFIILSDNYWMGTYSNMFIWHEPHAMQNAASNGIA